MLPVTRKAVANPSRQARVALVIVAAVTFAVPTVYVSRAPAAPATAPENKPQPAAPDADHEDTAGRPVRVELVGGGVLEFVGVGEHPSQDKPWWAPDASPAAAPYHDLCCRIGVGGSEFVREFAMQWVERPPAGVDANWGIKGSGSGGSGPPVDDEGKRVKGLEAAARAFPVDTKTCTVEISVARGPWETLAETDGESIQSLGRQKYGFAFSPTAERGSKLLLTVSHNVTGKDVRVIAVDGDGKTVAVGNCSGVGAAGFMQTVAQFPKAKMDGVHKYLVQARDYEHYEIRDVSLWPGEKTLPLVVNVQLRNRLELLDKVDDPAARLSPLDDPAIPARPTPKDQ